MMHSEKQSRKRFEPLRVCILAQNALPVIDPKSEIHFGGLETTAWLTAKGLAQLSNCEVDLLVRSSHNRKPKLVEKVNVLTCCSRLELIRHSLEGRLRVTNQFPWIKIIRWESSLAWKIPVLTVARLFGQKSTLPQIVNHLKELAHDVVCLFGVNSVSADAIRALAQTSTRTFLFVQSNAGLDEKFATDNNFTNSYGESGADCTYALTHATQVVTQTRYQQRILKERFDVDSLIQGNPFDFNEWNSRSETEFKIPIPVAKYLLWIGRSDSFHKRPLEFLKAAKACPDVNFVMILNHGDPEIRAEVERTCPSNVTIINHVPYEKMPSVFQNCVAFVTTSTLEYEGLPNVILQAAASGKPVIGLDYVPEQFIEANAAIVAGSIPNLSTEIQRFWNDADDADKIGTNGRNYMTTHGSLADYSMRVAKMLGVPE